MKRVAELEEYVRKIPHRDASHGRNVDAVPFCPHPVVRIALEAMLSTECTMLLDHVTGDVKQMGETSVLELVPEHCQEGEFTQKVASHQGKSNFKQVVIEGCVKGDFTKKGVPDQEK